MEAARVLRRSPIIPHSFRLHSRPCTTTSASASAETTTIATTSSFPSPQPRRRYPPPRPHEFSQPTKFLGSWDPPSNPREAEARLDRLRKDYAKQMKQARLQYSYEMDLLRAEKQRKDEARREAARVANEERKALKAAAAQSRAAERQAFQQEFRQMLMKERAQKLESWRAKEEMREKKRSEKRELLRLKSSVWVTEENLEKKIHDAIVDTYPLH